MKARPSFALLAIAPVLEAWIIATFMLALLYRLVPGAYGGGVAAWLSGLACVCAGVAILRANLSIFFRQLASAALAAGLLFLCVGLGDELPAPLDAGASTALLLGVAWLVPRHGTRVLLGAAACMYAADAFPATLDERATFLSVAAFLGCLVLHLAGTARRRRSALAEALATGSLLGALLDLAGGAPGQAEERLIQALLIGAFGLASGRHGLATLAAASAAWTALCFVGVL